VKEVPTGDKDKSKHLNPGKVNELVSEWMTPDPLSVFPHQSLREAALILQDQQIDGLPVVDDQQKVIGMVSKSEILNGCLAGLSMDSRLAQAMTDRVVTIHEDDLIQTGWGIQLECLPVVNNEGRLTGLLTRRDILNSYAAYFERLQETLHISETLSSILDNAYEGVVLVDSDGIIREFNEAYSRFLGMKREDAIGKPVVDIIENTRLAVVLQTGREERGYIQRIQGQDMVVHRIPIRKEGKVIGAIGMLIFHGVTELYTILEKMQEMSRKITEPPVQFKPESKPSNAFDVLIGHSAEIQSTKRTARKAANTPSTVLITGESGTGKEMFAKAIHLSSPFAEGPFITVNCAAIPEHLMEAELFGFEDGAFTGAKRGGKPGKFELAHKGTLFLDEIGDMPLMMQAKILRVLQEREVERVGGVVKHRLDVRIIAATNCCLEQMVRDGTFREDLFYRLNIIRLEIPPLRERREDIPDLLNYQLQYFCQSFGFELKTFTEEVMAILVEYSWPGNIRELVNTVEMLVSLSEANVIQVRELPAKFFDRNDQLPTSAGLSNAKELAGEWEKELIIKTLTKCGGNKAKAARELGIQRTTLYEKLRKYGLADKVFG
jgi:PAS domain S-box-containing protein